MQTIRAKDVEDADFQAAKLLVEGHTCLRDIETLPPQIDWCGSTPCKNNKELHPDMNAETATEIANKVLINKLSSAIEAASHLGLYHTVFDFCQLNWDVIRHFEKLGFGLSEVKNEGANAKPHISGRVYLLLQWGEPKYEKYRHISL